MSVDKIKVCPTCKGVGLLNQNICTTCEGTGVPLYDEKYDEVHNLFASEEKYFEEDDE